MVKYNDHRTGFFAHNTKVHDGDAGNGERALGHEGEVIIDAVRLAAPKSSNVVTSNDSRLATAHEILGNPNVLTMKRLGKSVRSIVLDTWRLTISAESRMVSVIGKVAGPSQTQVAWATGSGVMS
jgi:hypothetical protein